MSLFRKNNDFRVRNFILKLVNNHCLELKAQTEGPRAESRADMVVVATIIPIENARPQVHRAFAVTTKEFSSTGLSVVLDQPRGLDEVILGVRFDGGMNFLRAQAKHLNPMGGGFFELGFCLTEMVSVGDYPELESVDF